MRKKHFRSSIYRRYLMIGRTLLIVVFALLLLGCIYCESVVAPFMTQYTVMKGQQTMTELFNQTVNSKMAELNLSNDNLMSLTYSNDGKVQSLNTDVVVLNKLKGEVTDELSRLLSEKYEYAVDIPLGSLFKSEFLSGSGKCLRFNNVVTGDVKSEFRSEFETGGVNQTIHRLYIDLTGDLLIIGGGEQIPIELTSSVLVGETVLVGNVPTVVK